LYAARVFAGCLRDDAMRLDEIRGILKSSRSFNYRDVEVLGITQDSRRVKPGYLFFACAGTNADGHSFIPSAVRNGAAAVIAERKEILPCTVPLLVVSDTRACLADVSAHFYGHPSRDVDVIGVTGTNGKTTTTYLIRSIFGAAGQECGVLGTISYRIGARNIPAEVTTPGSFDIQRFLAEMSHEGITKAAIEVSSHALDQSRVRGVVFKCAIFTNLSGEHLDYHRTMEAYEQAKSRLFLELPDDSFAVINIDDAAGRRMLERTRARVVTYGIENSDADVTGCIKEITLDGSFFELLTKSGKAGLPAGKVGIHTPLIGRHNVYNILAGSACCMALGVRHEAIREGAENMTVVRGRLERVFEPPAQSTKKESFTVLVDYAHTDGALACVLSCLRGLVKGDLIVVFGCGGDRDKEKRPRMGAAVERYADRAWITSDNPRSEDPVEIIEQIKSGIRDSGKFRVEPDRRQAIGAAIDSAASGDLVVIAGKGHETYIEMKDKIIPFDDREVARQFLKRKKKNNEKVVF